MKKIYFFLLILFSTVIVYAQSSNEVLINKSVVDLKLAGLGKSTIIGLIAKSPCKFEVDIKDIIALKKEGLEDEIIDAMVEKMAKGNTSTSPALSNSVTKIVEDLQRQGTGIYYMSNAILQEVEPTVCSQSKVGSGLLTSLTYGVAKVKSKLSVSGNKANLQLQEKKPMFYFYFNNEQKNLNQQVSSFFASATNPNEFMLVKFELKRGKSSRDITVGSANAYEGSSTGVDDENKRNFKFKKLTAGIYEVYFDTDLAPGEYCFMYAGSVSNGLSPKVYDFGVQ